MENMVEEREKEEMKGGRRMENTSGKQVDRANEK